MEAIAELISKFGVSLVIVALFIYDWLSTRKSMKETLEQNNICLKEIQCTNQNTAKSLELLQKSMDTQQDFLQIHDKRCETNTNAVLEINKEIAKINMKLDERRQEYHE